MGQRLRLPRNRFHINSFAATAASWHQPLLNMADRPIHTSNTTYHIRPVRVSSTGVRRTQKLRTSWWEPRAIKLPSLQIWSRNIALHNMLFLLPGRLTLLFLLSGSFYFIFSEISPNKYCEKSRTVNSS